MPLFVVFDSEGTIRGLYQPSKADRLNFRTVYGIARYEARANGGTVQIIRAPAK